MVSRGSIISAHTIQPLCCSEAAVRLANVLYTIYMIYIIQMGPEIIVYHCIVGCAAKCFSSALAPVL